MDEFSSVFGDGRGATAAGPVPQMDGRPEPMGDAQVLSTVQFLAPELVKRAGARTKAWREGPAAGWVIAYLVYASTPNRDLTQWWYSREAGFWRACGLAATPSAEETRRFFADVRQQLDDGPTTVRALADVLPDIARCGVGPVARIDPDSLKTVRAPRTERAAA